MISGVLVLLGGFFLLFLHFIALSFYLYWFYWWLDLVMHFLGGFWVGLLLIWIFSYFRFFRPVSLKLKILNIMLFVILISILWEIFEFLIGHVDPSIGREYQMDTITDLVAGMLGGITVSVAYYCYEVNTKLKKFLKEKIHCCFFGAVL